LANFKLVIGHDALHRSLFQLQNSLKNSSKNLLEEISDNLFVGYGL
jgi:hypothetical protein